MLLLPFFLVSITSASAFGLGCPSGCVCDDETFVVHCEHGKLDVLPITLNPAIQRLSLQSNKIKAIDSAFTFYKDLQYADLSNNNIVSIPKESFLSQEKLQELHLNKNKLSEINNITFKGLKSLTVLNLRENYIEDITSRIFATLPKLEELNLGQNRIVKIDPKGFDGLLSLKVLYIDDNMLNVVPTPSFGSIVNLAELHIGLNDFKGLPDDAFKGLSTLTVLDISGANLVNLSENSFRGLTGLRNLNVAGNQLTKVPTKQLSNLSRLEELTIGQNSFTVIEAGAFKGLINLRKLEVRGASSLVRVEKSAFIDNFNLETLNLVSNRQLENLEEGCLSGLTNLRHLDVRGNGFKTFPESLIGWNELRTFDLSGNPIHCDCKLLWLGNQLASKNLTTVLCSTPQNLRDKPLKSLTADDLGCSFTDPKQQAIIITFGVSGIILVCGLGLLLFRYRQRVREALKDYKWNKRAISRKEHEYQKTFSDDDYIMRMPQHNMIKPIPVTEL